MELRLLERGTPVAEAARVHSFLGGSAGDAGASGLAAALADGQLACLVAEARGRLEGLAAFGVLPSLYSGRLWGHIDEVVARERSERVADSVLAGAVQAMAAAGAADMSVTLPGTGGAAERAGRAQGFGDEELRLYVRRTPRDVPAARRGGVEVRSAVQCDAGAITALVRQFADEYGEPCAADAASVRRYLDTKRVGALVATLGHEIAGLLAFSTSFHPSSGRCSTLDDLVVRRTARRRGVASALLQAALSRAAAAGATRVSLWLQPGNEAAEALYRGHGFRDGGMVLVRHAASRASER